MANLNEIHADVKVLTSRVDALITALAPLPGMNEKLTTHQVKIENIEENVIPPLQDDVKALNRWKWGQGISSFSFSAILTYIHHILLKGNP